MRMARNHTLAGEFGLEIGASQWASRAEWSNALLGKGDTAKRRRL
jgi:hypothetical protein